MFEQLGINNLKDESSERHEIMNCHWSECHLENPCQNVHNRRFFDEILCITSYGFLRSGEFELPLYLGLEYA